MIKERQKLIIGEEYLIGKPEFSGIWKYVGEDKENYIFAFAKNLERKIIELYIPKKRITIDEKNSEILGEEYSLNVCHIEKNRKRFSELAEKIGLLIQNKNLN